MKVAALGASLIAALAVSACSVGAPHVPPQQGHAGPTTSQAGPAPVMPTQAKRFACENGLSVQIRHLSGDRVELRLDDKQAVLTQAVSGSGERFVGKQGLFGKGAEWHQKGNEGNFSFTDPYGNAVETVCRAAS